MAFYKDIGPHNRQTHRSILLRGLVSDSKGPITALTCYDRIESLSLFLPLHLLLLFLL
jgi:hypothetical protein